MKVLQKDGENRTNGFAVIPTASKQANKNRVKTDEREIFKE